MPDITQKEFFSPDT